MRIQITATFSLALLAITFAGCSKGAPTPGNETKAANSNTAANTTAPAKNESASPNSQASTNSNPSPAKPADSATAAAESVDPAKLIGLYEMVQVQKGGVVSMLSEAKTRIAFNPDGTYKRESRVRDKVIHDDSGAYRVADGNQLVLMIQVSKKNIHNPPIEKRHKISLSRDGEELKMISKDGDEAVFRRVRK